MKAPASNIENVDGYIADFPKETRKLLQQLRATILKAAPLAEETLSYHMPFYRFHGRIVYFAAYQHHIGFYPMASGIATFQKEISKYKYGKGSIQFPLDKPLPIGLITRIIKFRVKRNLDAMELRKIKKPASRKAGV